MNEILIIFRAEVYYQTMNIQTITQKAKYDVGRYKC